jgi:hypothetical protein
MTMATKTESESEKFNQTMRKILSVSKEELQRRLEEEKKTRGEQTKIYPRRGRLREHL